MGVLEVRPDDVGVVCRDAGLAPKPDFPGTVGLIGSGMDCFASYCLSKQGKMGINVGGYRFRFNGCARNGKIRWRCSRGPWCKAALHTYKGRVVYIQSLHNCGPKPPIN
ncbi:hypothetical protein O0L34_g17058 [Tuta absoluta]|nr:hypothetical protein O0L34_g17058 [Tuta absoluta]